MVGEEYKYITACERNGAQGNCGVECDEFISGGCPEAGAVFEDLYPTWTSPPHCTDARLRVGRWWVVRSHSGYVLTSDGQWQDPGENIEGALFATEDAARRMSEQALMERIKVVQVIISIDM